MAANRPWLGKYFGPWILRVLGVEYPERNILEVIGGDGVTVAAEDDPSTDATKITISASGGGGGAESVGVDGDVQFSDGAGGFTNLTTGLLRTRYLNRLGSGRSGSRWTEDVDDWDDGSNFTLTQYAAALFFTEEGFGPDDYGGLTKAVVSVDAKITVMNAEGGHGFFWVARTFRIDLEDETVVVATGAQVDVISPQTNGTGASGFAVTIAPIDTQDNIAVSFTSDGTSPTATGIVEWNITRYVAPE